MFIIYRKSIFLCFKLLNGFIIIAVHVKSKHMFPLSLYKVLYEKIINFLSSASVVFFRQDKSESGLHEVNYHGAVLLTKLLQFGNPAVVVASLLHLSQQELQVLACNPCGSHVLEMFMSSGSIGAKSHIALYDKMKVTDSCYTLYDRMKVTDSCYTLYDRMKVKKS